MDQYEVQRQQGAAAAVSALYFLCFFGSMFNLWLTRFRLYVPVSLASLVRAISFAARAAYYTSGNMDLLAVNRAFQAVGLGISIAMCCCFMIVWLRNARPNYQPGKAAAAFGVLFKLLIACVIVLGPILGITSVGVINSKPGDAQMMQTGSQIRKASVTGFLVISSLVALLTSSVAFFWIIGATDTEQQQQHISPSTLSAVSHPAAMHSSTDFLQDGTAAAAAAVDETGPSSSDRLVFLLLSCELLLLWSAAALVASVDHPELVTDAQLYYPIAVLPELIVAAVWAAPLLAAKVALGANFGKWRQQQQQQQQGGRAAVELQARGVVDAEAVAESGSEGSEEHIKGSRV